MEQGDLRKAGRFIDRAKKGRVTHPTVLLVEGHLAARQGQHCQARERYLAALQYSTSDADRVLALYSLGVFAERREEFDEAGSYLRQALCIDDTDPYLLSHLAYVESRLGDAQSAETHYRQALEVCDGLPEVWVSLGMLCLEREDAEKAQWAFTRALALDEAAPKAHAGMAKALVASGQYEAALPHALRAVQLAPDASEFVGYLGFVYDLLSKNDAAEHWYRRALELEHGWAWAWTRLGWLRYLALDLSGAREAFEKALELDEDDSDAHLGMSEISRKLGDDEGSVRHLRRVVALEPDNPEHLADLAIALASLGRQDEAARSASEALTIGDQRASVWAKVGWARLKGWDMAEGKEAFRRALDLDEECAHAHQGMAKVLDEEQQTQEALSHARRAAELAPNDPGCQFTLGEVLEHRGGHEDAETAFRKAVELNPYWALAHLSLACVLTGQGRDREAEAERARAADLSSAVGNHPMQ
jgi:Flp pilus assembly protein TadD